MPSQSTHVAVKVLKKLTSISISVSHLTKLTETIGEELAAARDQQADQHVAGKLEPEVEAPPQALVAVGTDGGRAFTRAEDAGRGVHDPAWKETKVACLLRLAARLAKWIRIPQFPGCFADQESVGKLVREYQIHSQRNGRPRGKRRGGRRGGFRRKRGRRKPAGFPGFTAEIRPRRLWRREVVRCENEEEPGPKPQKNKKDWRPKRRVRTCVSSMCNSDEFGPKVAAEARRRRFFEAARRAFLGDGLKWNWACKRNGFPTSNRSWISCIPRRTSMKCRVVAADDAAAWSLCQRWLEACWQGRVSSVLEELRGWQAFFYRYCQG